MAEEHRNITHTQHVREEAELGNRSKSITKQIKKAVGRSRERGQVTLRCETLLSPKFIEEL